MGLFPEEGAGRGLSEGFGLATQENEVVEKALPPSVLPSFISPSSTSPPHPHPNVAKTLKPSETMQEWVPGGELFHHLDLEGAFDEPTAQFYAASVLLALEFLHDRGFVYRDLKPENLLLARRPRLLPAWRPRRPHLARPPTSPARRLAPHLACRRLAACGPAIIR